MDCKRSITFVIPGTGGAPDVQVMVVEDNGSLDFTLEVVGNSDLTADLRGLFFNLNDPSKLGGLELTANDGTVTNFDTGEVIDLGNGANMQGAADPFDVGLELGPRQTHGGKRGRRRFRILNGNQRLGLTYEVERIRPIQRAHARRCFVLHLRHFLGFAKLRSRAPGGNLVSPALGDRRQRCWIVYTVERRNCGICVLRFQRDVENLVGIAQPGERTQARGCVLSMTTHGPERL